MFAIGYVQTPDGFQLVSHHPPQWDSDNSE